MLIGMTGFGRAQFKDKEIEITLQMRSVNHRFFDVAFHLPHNLIYLEEPIKKYLRRRLYRGRITLNLFVAGNLPATINVNEALAKQYIVALRRMRKNLALCGEINSRDVVFFPGVFSLKDSEISKNIWPKIQGLLSSACDTVIAMRLKEGVALGRDIGARLRKINNRIAFVRRRLQVFAASRRKRIEENGGKAEEANAIIKNCDISEEVMRLEFHTQNFAAKINSRKRHNLAGKELDFLAQEMQREANTMGAKSQDAPLSGAVVEIKSEIEKIREQVQNVA